MDGRLSPIEVAGWAGLTAVLLRAVGWLSKGLKAKDDEAMRELGARVDALEAERIDLKCDLATIRKDLEFNNQVHKQIQESIEKIAKSVQDMLLMLGNKRQTD